MARLAMMPSDDTNVTKQDVTSGLSLQFSQLFVRIDMAIGLVKERQIIQIFWNELVSQQEDNTSVFKASD
jgi:hypothetical protein